VPWRRKRFVIPVLVVCQTLVAIVAPMVVAAVIAKGTGLVPSLAVTGRVTTSSVALLDQLTAELCFLPFT
jgi:hypothetical protein